MNVLKLKAWRNMKLINKLTRQHGRLASNTSKSLRVIDRKGKTLGVYKTLKDLTSVWTDFKDLKQFYFIGAFSEVHSGNIDNEDLIAELKSIGNYFETREEAEETVEKLRAWKRLTDKGFKIESWSNDVGDNYYKSGQIELNLNNVRNREWDEYDQIMEIKIDLDILFGGEQ